MSINFEDVGESLNLWLNAVSLVSAWLVIVLATVVRDRGGGAGPDQGLPNHNLFPVARGWVGMLAASFAIQWTTLVYIFLNSAIALNLQLVFVHGLQFRPRWEAMYWYGALSGASVIASAPLDSVTCDYRFPEQKSTYAWQWGSFFTWIFCGCAYCSVVVSLTIWRLRCKQSVVDRLVLDPTTDPNKLVRLRQDIRRLIRRVALYCIIPVVTQLGYPINLIHIYHTQRPSTLLSLVSIVGSDLPGFLNLIAFTLDPAFTNALFALRRSFGLDFRSRLTKLSKTQKLTSTPYEPSATPPSSASSQLSNHSLYNSEPWPDSKRLQIHPGVHPFVKGL
ncbi:hypothetical protein L0F63_003212 [Massospora cicadina]|nr:hypothetical protein L0F63_003212 [Massospora cicadina]